MTYHAVEPSVGRLIVLGLEHELPAKVEQWKTDLAAGRMTDEMRQVFVGMGWLSSLRDRRLSAIEEVDPRPAPHGRRSKGVTDRSEPPSELGGELPSEASITEG